MGMPEYPDGTFGPIKPIGESVEDLREALFRNEPLPKALHVGKIEDLLKRASNAEKKEKPRFVYDPNLVEDPGEEGHVKLTQRGAEFLELGCLKIRDMISQINPEVQLVNDKEREIRLNGRFPAPTGPGPDPSAQDRIDGSKAEVLRYRTVTGELKADPIREPYEEPVIRIKFQSGPIKEAGVNGCQIEDVIQVLIDRLMGFQNGPFPCRENVLALLHLGEAKDYLVGRTIKRQAQGVEGSSLPHEK